MYNFITWEGACHYSRRHTRDWNWSFPSHLSKAIAPRTGSSLSCLIIISLSNRPSHQHTNMLWSQPSLKRNHPPKLRNHSLIPHFPSFLCSSFQTNSPKTWAYLQSPLSPLFSPEHIKSGFCPYSFTEIEIVKVMRDHPLPNQKINSQSSS